MSELEKIVSSFEFYHWQKFLPNDSRFQSIMVAAILPIPFHRQQCRYFGSLGAYRSGGWNSVALVSEFVTLQPSVERLPILKIIKKKKIGQYIMTKKKIIIGQYIMGQNRRSKNQYRSIYYRSKWVKKNRYIIGQNRSKKSIYYRSKKSIYVNILQVKKSIYYLYFHLSLRVIQMNRCKFLVHVTRFI